MLIASALEGVSEARVSLCSFKGPLEILGFCDERLEVPLFDRHFLGDLKFEEFIRLATKSGQPLGWWAMIEGEPAFFLYRLEFLAKKSDLSLHNPLHI